MNILKFGLAILAVAILSGCTHPLIISPNMSKIERGVGAQPRIKQNVAYYISDGAIKQEVTTPGGGGEKVSYFPYRDIETAFYKMLSNVYDNVIKLAAPADAEAIRRDNIAYVFTPEIITNSSSPSPFTWPPTKFSVDLTCKVSDASGKVIDSKKVVGQGEAEFAEFKSDFSLSARRAMEDALLQMQRSLLERK